MAKTFYNIVFTLTVVIAILVLAGMGVLMLLGKETAVWPPDPSECPDYWIVNSDGTCSPQGAVGNAGSHSAGSPAPLPNCESFDPTTCGGQGPSCTYKQVLADVGKAGALIAGSPRCQRQAWANNCGVYWDGISDISPMYCAGASHTPSPSPGTCDCKTCKPV